jgi:hypothetical protein
MEMEEQDFRSSISKEQKNKGGEKMKRSGLLAVLFLACAFFLMAGNSQADSISGKIWQITGYSDTNDAIIVPGSLPLATFTVDAINFDSAALRGFYEGSVTYTQFLANSYPNVIYCFR